VNGSERLPKPFIIKSQSQLQLRTVTHDIFFDLIGAAFYNRVAFARLLRINVEGVGLAPRDGVLQFLTQQANGGCWSVIDKNHKVRQDGKPFVFKERATAKSRTIESPSWPIEIPTAKEVVLLTEGSSDLLAAYPLADAEKLENLVIPVTIPGVSNSIHPDARQYFKGKRILGFLDSDSPEISGIFRWRNQFEDIAIGFQVFDYVDLVSDNEKPIKDLHDFLRINVDQWEQSSRMRHPPIIVFTSPHPHNRKKEMQNHGHERYFQSKS
jgi:hypothetical protein